MTTITDKLAQALRAALTDLQAISDAREGSHGKTCDLAIDALAEYDAQRALPTPRNLTAREWVERARDTLDARTRKENDADLIDAHDDLCNALELMKEQQA